MVLFRRVLLGLGVAGFAGINLALVAFWLFVAYLLYGRYEALTAKA